MKKTFKISVDCANCAAKAESNIRKVDGVSSASINFFAQRLTLEYDDMRQEDILKQVVKAGKRADSDFSLSVC